MVFLHLLPSPSSCALRLTPKPPRRILSQRRGCGVSSGAHAREEAQVDPGRRGAATGAPLRAGVAPFPGPPAGDLVGGAESASLPVEAARSPPSLLRLLGPKPQARGAGTCGSCLGSRGLARSPVPSAPASTPSSFLFSGLPVSLPPPHLSVSFLLFPFPPFLVPFFSPISFKISPSYKKSAPSLPEKSQEESTLGNLPVYALSNLPLPFTHPCKTREGLPFYRLALTFDSLAPLSPRSLPLSTSVNEYWVNPGKGWLHGHPRCQGCCFIL